MTELDGTPVRDAAVQLRLALLRIGERQPARSGALRRPFHQAEQQAAAAPLAILDYVGIGGVYGTTSKASGKTPIGLEGLSRVIQVFRHRIGNFPACGIAGITVANAEAVIAAGADGVSVISALSYRPDPAAAARQLRAVVDAALKKYAPTVPAVGVHSHGGAAGVGA